MLSVKGSLLRHLSWWRENIANSYILNTIEHGYQLPLLEIPVPVMLPNNKSAFENKIFVTAEIARLVSSGVLLHVSCQPTVVNAITVAVNASGKQRMVLDLRTVNPLLLVPRYKYEDVSTAGNYFKKDGWMATFDLKSGYHHIDIHVAFQQYLGLCWEGKFYVFTSCPFGMSVSGLIFTKVLRELVRKWRSAGIAIVLYIDDGILVAESAQKLDHAVAVVKNDLQSAGFILNEEKTKWTASQNVTWLGFTLDSDKNLLSNADLLLGNITGTGISNNGNW
jgi:hypothetical protein